MRKQRTSMMFRLPFCVVFLLLFCVITAAADSGDDFSNNLFSDLAPLLTLFGEQVANQFLSQSMGWADNIIFAMAPLGIITAIVAAIRVGGPTWLRAIIGRAKESQGTAELELMSSTSSSVCELWNGQAIVRVLGSPEIVELVYLERNAPEDPHSPPEPLEVYSFEESKSYPSEHNPLYEQEQKRQRWGIGDSDGYELLSADPGQRPFDEDFVNLEESVSNTCAPNISLNARGESASQAELWSVAILGIIAQVGVIVYDGVITLYDPFRYHFKKNGRQPAGYAFPMTAIGSIAVSLGMLICSHVVEASTVEEKWKAREGDKRIKFAWLQRGQVVSDQEFDSYALFCLDDKQDVMTSRARNNLRGFGTLVLIGTGVSLIGFIAQFMGLRGMHWSATIAQLIATGFMSVMRAIIRRHLTRNPRAKKLIKNFELDCMAREIVNCKRFCLPSGRVERSVDIDNFYENLNISGEALGRELVDTRVRLKNISGWTSHFHQEVSALCDAIEQAMELICDSSSEFTQVQRYLDLAEFKWSLTVRTQAGCEDGVDRYENIVFKMTRRKPKEFGEQWGKWRINRSQIEAVYSLSMLELHEQERKHLSLQNRGERSGRQRDDLESQGRNLRFMGFGGDDIGCAYARCIYDWWIARETECFEVEDPTDAAAENAIAPFHIVGGMSRNPGWGVAVVSETPLEKLCAQHIFSIFMSSASDLITSLPGEMTVRRNNKRKVGSFGITHSGVEKLAHILQQAGLANLEDSYMSIVPPLAERLPSILDVQPDILRLAKGHSTGGKRDDMLFWLDFTCHVAARTSIRNRKGLNSYILTGEAYFKTAMACMSALGENHNKTLTAVRDLLRACKVVVFKAETIESEIPEDLADARNWYGTVFEWIEEHSQRLSVLENELFRVGLLKLIELYRSRFGEWAQAEDDTRYSASQLFLIDSSAVARWNKEQEYLRETWTKLEEDGVANYDRATLSNAISSALSDGYDAVSEILLQNMSDVVALSVQMEYGTSASALLSGVNESQNCEQAIIREFTMRCASRTFNVDSEDESGVTALCQAVISGERYLVETLLDSHGANINKKDKKQRSPIFMAATLGHREIFHFLLERGAHWGGHHECGNTCLHVAASNGFEDILEVLLEPGNQLRAVDPTNIFGETPLHFAARSGNLFSIHHLHRMGADVNKMTHHGHTPLAYAAAYGNLAVVQALKEKGANIDVIRSSGESILHVATKYRHPHIVAELLRSGVVPQWNCVQEALKSGDDDIVENLLKHLLSRREDIVPLMDLPQRKLLKLLKSKELSAFGELTKNFLLRAAVKHGANIDRIYAFSALGADTLSMDGENNSALSLGAARGDYDLVALLFKPPQVQQDFMHKESKFQEVILRIAIESGNAQVVALLLGACSIPTNDGQFSQLLLLSTQLGYSSVTNLLYNHEARMDDDAIRSLLQTAVSEGSEEILNLLDTMGVCIKDEAEKEFSLHSAARLGKDNIVSALLTFGVKVDSSAQNGWTALQIAAQEGHLGVVKLLVEGGAQVHKKNMYGWSAVSLAHARQYTDIADILAIASVDQSDQTPNSGELTVASPRPEPEESNDPWANIFELDTGPIVVENQEAELSFQLAPAIDQFPLISFELHNTPVQEEGREETNSDDDLESNAVRRGSSGCGGERSTSLEASDASGEGDIEDSADLGLDVIRRLSIPSR